MVEYFVIASITVFIAYLTKLFEGRVQYIIVLLTGVPSALLAAVRYGIGPDYPLYVDIFETIRNTGTFFSVKSLEPGYTFLNHLVLFFNGDYRVLFFIVAWLVATFFFLGSLRMSKNYVLSVALFFSLGFYCDSLNGLRQYIAAAMTFFALSFLIRGERKKAIVTTLVATLFHRSALIMVLACLLSDRVKLNSWKAICITFITIVGGNYIFDFVSSILSFSRYSYYLNSIEYVVEPTLGTTLLTIVITAVALAIGVFKSTNDSAEHRVLTNMGLFALLSALLSFFVPLALRLQYYFVPIEMVFIPYLLSFAKSSGARFLVGCCLFLVFLGMNIVGMVFNGWYGAYPYQMIG